MKMQLAVIHKPDEQCCRVFMRTEFGMKAFTLVMDSCTKQRDRVIRKLMRKLKSLEIERPLENWIVHKLDQCAAAQRAWEEDAAAGLFEDDLEPIDSDEESGSEDDINGSGV